MVGIALFVEGCSGSSPRFKSDDVKEAEKKDRPAEQRFVFSAPEEEMKNSDPDSEDRELIGPPKRDFRKEKNPSITPLDQSRMMREISKYMGTRYVEGGESTSGIDCSGYVMIVYKQSINKQLPRKSSEQARIGRAVEYDDLKFGDLVFFNTRNESFSHVGIYLGDDLFAHASLTFGVTISSLGSAYYKKRYEGARRIIE